MELNWDCVTGKVVCDPCRIIDFEESVRKLAFLRMDLFGGGFVTALTAAGFGRAGKCGGNKGEEDNESDREAKKHVRRKTINEDYKNEGGGCIAIARDMQESKGR